MGHGGISVVSVVVTIIALYAASRWLASGSRAAK